MASSYQNNDDAVHLYLTACGMAVFRASIGKLGPENWLVNLYPHRDHAAEYVWLVWYGDKLDDYRAAIKDGGIIRKVTLNEAALQSVKKLQSVRGRYAG